MSGAFHNDAGLKAQACTEAAAGSNPGWSVIATDEERAACSARYNLHASFINLLSHGFHVPYGEGALPLLERALLSLAPGADTLVLVRNWVNRLWVDPEIGMKARLDGTVAFAPAEQVIRLVRQSAREPVSRDEWRRARGALNSVKAQAPELAPYVEMVATMAWDLATTPKVTTDIWNAWQTSVSSVLDREAGWDKDKQDEVLEAFRRSLHEAHEEIGQLSAEVAASAEHNARVNGLVQAKMEAAGQAGKFQSLQDHFASTMTPAMMKWREVAHQSLLDACRMAEGS